jgi:hypothetical protein
MPRARPEFIHLSQAEVWKAIALGQSWLCRSGVNSPGRRVHDTVQGPGCRAKSRPCVAWWEDSRGWGSSGGAFRVDVFITRDARSTISVNRGRRRLRDRRRNTSRHPWWDRPRGPVVARIVKRWIVPGGVDGRRHDCARQVPHADARHAGSASSTHASYYSIYSINDGLADRPRGISELGCLVSTPWTHKSFIDKRRLISQAGRRGFEPRLPLHVFNSLRGLPPEKRRTNEVRPI